MSSTFINIGHNPVFSVLLVLVGLPSASSDRLIRACR